MERKESWPVRNWDMKGSPWTEDLAELNLTEQDLLHQRFENAKEDSEEENDEHSEPFSLDSPEDTTCRLCESLPSSSSSTLPKLQLWKGLNPTAAGIRTSKTCQVVSGQSLGIVETQKKWLDKLNILGCSKRTETAPKTTTDAFSRTATGAEGGQILHIAGQETTVGEETSSSLEGQGLESIVNAFFFPQTVTRTQLEELSTQSSFSNTSAEDLNTTEVESLLVIAGLTGPADSVLPSSATPDQQSPTLRTRGNLVPEAGTSVVTPEARIQDVKPHTATLDATPQTGIKYIIRQAGIAGATSQAGTVDVSSQTGTKDVTQRKGTTGLISQTEAVDVNRAAVPAEHGTSVCTPTSWDSREDTLEGQRDLTSTDYVENRIVYRTADGSDSFSSHSSCHSTEPLIDFQTAFDRVGISSFTSPRSDTRSPRKEERQWDLEHKENAKNRTAEFTCDSSDDSSFDTNSNSRLLFHAAFEPVGVGSGTLPRKNSGPDSTEEGQRGLTDTDNVNNRFAKFTVSSSDTSTYDLISNSTDLCSRAVVELEQISSSASPGRDVGSDTTKETHDSLHNSEDLKHRSEEFSSDSSDSSGSESGSNSTSLLIDSQSAAEFVRFSTSASAGRNIPPRSTEKRQSRLIKKGDLKKRICEFTVDTSDCSQGNSGSNSTKLLTDFSAGSEFLVVAFTQLVGTAYSPFQRIFSEPSPKEKDSQGKCVISSRPEGCDPCASITPQQDWSSSDTTADQSCSAMPTSTPGHAKEGGTSHAEDRAKRLLNEKRQKEEERKREREARERERKAKLEKEKQDKEKREREKKGQKEKERKEREAREDATVTAELESSEDRSVFGRGLHTVLHLVFISLLIVAIGSLAYGVSTLFATSAHEVMDNLHNGLRAANFLDLAVALVGLIFFLFIMGLTILTAIMLIPALWVSLIEVLVCPWSVLSDYFLP